MSLFHYDRDCGVLRAAGPFAAAADWIEHGFGTRHAAAGWPPPAGGYVSLRQVHSAQVARFQAGAGDPLGEGDALVTNEPGAWIGVRTADCVPVLLADARHRAVAAVHSGWRGTAARVAVRAAERMTAEFGTRPADLRVVIGPAIGACCYEVSTGVAAMFSEGVKSPSRAGGKPHLDLAYILTRQLMEAGVSSERILSMGLCTRCDAEARFHSYRRDGDAAGRMVSAIRVRP